MLAKEHLRCRREGDLLVPCYLEPEHDAWLARIIEAFEACEGLTAPEVQDRARAAAARFARSVPVTVAQGVWHVLKRFSKAEVDAPLVPRELREAVFDLAGSMPLEVAKSTACASFGATGDDLVAWLYADLPSARVLRPRDLPDPAALRDAYNLALVQGLLGRCSEIMIGASADLELAIRAAKVHGLLVAIEEHQGALVARASGPLALFRHTLKYARALASFVPSLCTLAGWWIEGRIEWQDRFERLRIDARAPLPADKPELRKHSPAETRLFRGLTKLGWIIDDEPPLLRRGTTLLFPSFVICKGEVRAGFEVLRFSHPDYARDKRRALEAFVDPPIVVCEEKDLRPDWVIEAATQAWKNRERSSSPAR